MGKITSQFRFNENRCCDDCKFIQDLVNNISKDDLSNIDLDKLNNFRSKCSNCNKKQLKFDAIMISMYLQREKPKFEIKNRNVGKKWTMTDYELKSVFHMRNQGRTYQEIADEMGISYSKVYKTINLQFSSKQTNDFIKKKIKELKIENK